MRGKGREKALPFAPGCEWNGSTDVICNVSNVFFKYAAKYIRTLAPGGERRALPGRSTIDCSATGGKTQGVCGKNRAFSVDLKGRALREREEHLADDLARRGRGDAARVEVRRELDDVAADEV